MKYIKDPIHGEVAVNDEDLPILDSVKVQRLRRIKQIGLGDLVYPGANHTRFEHSIGAMHMATGLGRRMGFEEEEVRRIGVSALLHDIGHGPFSHTSEKFALAVAGLDHSWLTEREILEGSTHDLLMSCSLEPGEIAPIACGRDDGIGRLLHSQVGVDRMDYLLRDAHYTGVAYGVIDYDRIVSTLVFRGGEIVIREKGAQAAESLLVARFLMYPSVYLHHVARIADAMMLRALEGLNSSGFTVRQIMEMDDPTLINALLESGGPQSLMARRILDRDLFKRAVYLSRDQVPDLDELLPLAQDRGRSRALEDEIAGECGMEAGNVLVDVQASPLLDETGIKVLRGGNVEPLEDSSPLVRSLSEAQWKYWRFGVYCPRERLQDVRKVCDKRGWCQAEG